MTDEINLDLIAITDIPTFADICMTLDCNNCGICFDINKEQIL